MLSRTLAVSLAAAVLVPGASLGADWVNKDVPPEQWSEATHQCGTSAELTARREADRKGLSAEAEKAIEDRHFRLCMRERGYGRRGAGESEPPGEENGEPGPGEEGGEPGREPGREEGGEPGPREEEGPPEDRPRPEHPQPRTGEPPAPRPPMGRSGGPSPDTAM